MYVHQHQLEYVLSPEAYFSEEHYQRELDLVFRPTWHLVGSKSELPRDGDFRTLELLGEPLLIRNCDGQYQAFLNVCSHRHALLTHKPRGNAPTIRCQYHGWEYDSTGRTRKIPEAHCFRPFDRENARLHTFHLASCGDLLFVSLADDGPPLEEHLGDYYAVVERMFAPPWRQNWVWDYEYQCNWKLPVENTLESYHIPAVHPRSFSGLYPGDDFQEHTLSERSSTLRYNIQEHPLSTHAQRWTMRLLGSRSSDTYIHHLIHPNLVIMTTDVFAYAQCYLPTSPTTSRTLLRMVSYRGTKKGPLARLIARFVAMRGRQMNRQIQVEDAAVIADQQRGIQSSRFRGCIGTREERIYTLQQFIHDRCELAADGNAEPSSPPVKLPR